MKKIIMIIVGVLSLTFAGTTHATETFNKDLRYGQTKNTEVKHLQQFLKDQGYYKFDITGNYFLITKTAVKNFQTENNLKATGNFDKMTRSKVNDLLTINDIVSDSKPIDYNYHPITYTDPINSQPITTISNDHQLNQIPSNTLPNKTTTDEKREKCLADTQADYQSQLSSVVKVEDNQQVIGQKKFVENRKSALNSCLENISVGSFWDEATQSSVNLGEAINKGLTDSTIEQWCSGEKIKNERFNSTGYNWYSEVKNAENILSDITNVIQSNYDRSIKNIEDNHASAISNCNAIK